MVSHPFAYSAKGWGTQNLRFIAKRALFTQGFALAVRVLRLRSAQDDGAKAYSLTHLGYRQITVFSAKPHGSVLLSCGDCDEALDSCSLCCVYGWPSERAEGGVAAIAGTHRNRNMAGGGS